MSLSTGLIGYWKFDENTGTTAYDSLSTNDCALSDITWTTGKINYALYFKGPTTSSLADPTLSYNFNNDFSLNAWVKLDDITHVRYTVFGGFYNANNYFMVLHRADTDGMVMQYRLASTTTKYITTNAGNNTNFNMITLTRSGNDVVLYVNGVSKGTGTLSGTFAGSINLTIGKLVDGNPNIMKGIIDEAGIWSKALSSTEVSRLYNGGYGLTYPFTGKRVFFVGGGL